MGRTIKQHDQTNTANCCLRQSCKFSCTYPSTNLLLWVSKISQLVRHAHLTITSFFRKEGHWQTFRLVISLTFHGCKASLFHIFFQLNNLILFGPHGHSRMRISYIRYLTISVSILVREKQLRLERIYLLLVKLAKPF